MWMAEKTIQERYTQKCRNILSNWDPDFKKDPDYNSVVGMPESWQGVEWFNFLKERVPEDAFLRCKKNDEFPSSSMVDCGSFGTISASTLRYMYSAYDIIKSFPKLEKVGEIGVGFGGLCFVLCNMANSIKRYKFYDLPEVVKLAELYNEKLGNAVITGPTNNNNLLISEFCFSEFDDAQMGEFYSDIILKYDSIYLLMNLHELERKNFWINKISYDFNIKIEKEYPTTRWDNYVIKGNKK